MLDLVGPELQNYLDPTYRTYLKDQPRSRSLANKDHMNTINKNASPFCYYREPNKKGRLGRTTGCLEESTLLTGVDIRFHLARNLYYY